MPKAGREGVLELEGERRQPIPGRGDWFPVLRPGMMRRLRDGGAGWCHLPSLSFLSSNFTSAQLLPSAGYLPVTMGVPHVRVGARAAIFTFGRACCPGPVVAQEGAVLWAGRGSRTAGFQTSVERHLLPLGVTLCDCSLDPVPFGPEHPVSQVPMWS